MIGHSFDANPAEAPLLSDREWLRARFVQHLIRTGRYAADIGADSPVVCVRDLIARRPVWDPAQAGSA